MLLNIVEFVAAVSLSVCLTTENTNVIIIAIFFFQGWKIDILVFIF